MQSNSILFIRWHSIVMSFSRPLSVLRLFLAPLRVKFTSSVVQSPPGFHFPQAKNVKLAKRLRHFRNTVYTVTSAMSTHCANSPQILEIENDLQYLIQALATNHRSNPHENKKILATYHHLSVTHKTFNETIKQTQTAKEECHIRSRTQTKCHRKFINDLDIAWGAYDALANAVIDIETEIEQYHLINRMLDQADSQRTQELLALLSERDIAIGARENSDRLCADMTELAEQQREELVLLQAEWRGVMGRLEVLKRRSCVVDLVVRRVERGSDTDASAADGD